ncbi:MAG: hypothetical protein IKF36_00510 [Bacilli bacterium]|nr:hypothetical protein [Bacilli bacterium]
MGLETSYFIKLFNNRLVDIDNSIKEYSVKIGVLDNTNVFSDNSVDIEKLLATKKDTLFFFISDSLPGANNVKVVEDLGLYLKIMKSSKVFLRSTEQFKSLKDKVQSYIIAILGNYTGYKHEIEQLQEEKARIEAFKDVLENGFDITNGVNSEAIAVDIKKLRISDAEKTSLSMIILKTVTNQLAKEKEKREKKYLEELERRKNEALTRQMSRKPRETKEKNVRKIIDEIIDSNEEIKESIERNSILVDDLKNSIYNQISLRKELKISTPEFKETVEKLVNDFIEKTELEIKRKKYEDIIFGNHILYNYIKNQLSREIDNIAETESIVVDLVVSSCVSNNVEFDAASVYEIAKDINLSYFNRKSNEIITSLNIAKGLLSEGSDYIRRFERTDFTEEEVTETVERLSSKGLSVELLDKNKSIIESMIEYVEANIDLLYKGEAGDLDGDDVLLFNKLNMIMNVLIDINKTITFRKTDSLSEILFMLDEVVDAVANSDSLKEYKDSLVTESEIGTYLDEPNPFDKVLFLSSVDVKIEAPELVKLKSQVVNVLDQMEKTNVYEEMSIKAHNFGNKKNEAVRYLHKNEIICLKPGVARVFIRRVGHREEGERFDRYIIVFAEQKAAQGTYELINAENCANFLAARKTEFDLFVLLSRHGYVYINQAGDILDPTKVNESDIPNLRKYTYEDEQERQRGTANRIASYIGMNRGGITND